MKKNLAKRIVLGLLTGAVLMSSSVAWAGDGYNFDGTAQKSPTKPEDSISIIGSVYGPGDGTGAKRSIAIGVNSEAGSNLTADTIASDAVAVGYDTKITDAYGVALGSKAKVTALGGVALGANTKVETIGSVALGYGSAVNSGDSPYVVSVGSGNAEHSGTYQYRKIVNVANGSISEGSHEAVTGGQLHTTNQNVTALSNSIGEVGNFTNENLTYNCVAGATDLVGAVSMLDNQVYLNRNAIANKADADDVYSKTIANNKFLSKTEAASTYLTQTQADGLYVQIQKDAHDNNKTTTSIGDFVVENTGSSSTVTINENDDDKVVFDTDGITVGEHSARMSGSGFYVWAPNDSSNHNTDYAIASMTDDGKIKGANGNFEVGADGSVKAAGDKFKVDKDGNVSAEKITAKEVEAENLYTKAEIDEKLGGSNASVAGINQRLDRTNAKINKVGAGAAALAALHPLDYDPDDKLTFSAGMGNYAGENAAALGAFYRPNEKFMLSLGGTMGNGENMVNLGISIGLDKANGFAKMSKRELIQEVNAVKAENEAIKADNEAMKAEMAEMKAMLQELLAKK